MALTKADIVAEIYGQGILSKADANKAVETALMLMKQALINEDEVMISGFGKWAVRAKGERIGRNPQTGGSMTLGARKTVYFKCSRILKERVSGAA